MTMDSTMRTMLLRALMASAFLFTAALILPGFKGCAPDPQEDPSMCQAASDCEGMPHIGCVGEWSCEYGQCSYDCSNPPPPPPPPPTLCWDDSECGADEWCNTDVCAAPSGCDEEGKACLAVCYGECTKKDPEPTECTGDYDCGSGQYCDFITCEETECNCWANTDGEAPSDPPQGEKAGAPAPDCACFAEPQCWGVCKDKWEPPPPPPGCQDDSDCGPGQYCATDAGCPPCPPNAMCGACEAAGQCIDMPPPTEECLSENDCGSGEYCDFSECDYSCGCEPDQDCDCPELMPFCYGQCKPYDKPKPECSQDSDCGPNAYCELIVCESCVCADGAEDCDCAPMACWGYCVELPPPPPPEGCWDDSDCPSGQTCQCTADPSCPMCDVCYMQCMPTTKPETCGSDADCAAGESCEGPVCLMWCAEDDPNCCGGGVCVEKSEPNECVASGCSGEICAPQPVDSICIWQDWYECLQFSSCEPNPSGCGWVQNDELAACLEKYIGQGGDGSTPVPLPMP